MKKINFLLLTFFLFSNSCKLFQKKKTTTNPVVLLNDIKVSPTKNNKQKIAPLKVMDIIHADLSVRFDWSKHECYGQEKIILKPYFYDTDSILLDAKNMIITLVEVRNSKQEIIQHLVSYDQNTIKIFLEKNISKSDTISISINYTARPDLQVDGGSAAIKDDKGLYFINTQHKEPFKPMQIWTQGETQSNSNWFPTIDNPNEKFTSSLSITANKELTILSNGEKVSSLIDGNLKTEKWVNNKPMSAYLIMMAIGDFEIISDSILSKEVSYYLEKDYSPFAKNIFKNTPEMIQFYSEKLGVLYPWNKYAQVVVRDYVSGAMENTSATLHGDFVQKNDRQLVDGNNDDIIAHELFHQWFGDLVTCSNWSNLVLNEGFATFGEQLWFENKYGNNCSLFKNSVRLQKYLNYVATHPDEAIVNSNFKNQEEMFNSITYQKGACVLNLLRHELGDNAFFLSLKNYLQKYAYANADIYDLKKEFENFSGKDLLPFFTQWFLKGGHPTISVSYHLIDSSQQIEMLVEQTQSVDVGLFSFPFEIKIIQNNKPINFTFNVEKRKETFIIPSIFCTDSILPSIFLDPNVIFIGDIKELKSTYYFLKMKNEATTYIEKYRALKELSNLQNTEDGARLGLLTGLNDLDENIRINSLDLINWLNDKNYIDTKVALIHLAKQDENSIVRAKALNVLGNKKNPDLLNLYFQMVEDSSYNVAGNALEAIQKLIPEEALHIAPKLEKDAKGNLFTKISALYANYGDSSHLQFFSSNLMKVFTNKRANLLNDYLQLAIKVNQENKFDELINTFIERAKVDENNYIRYTAINDLNELNNYFSIQLKQRITEDKKIYYTTQSTLIQENIKSIINQEQDEYVLGLLKLKGLYNGVKE